MKNNTLPQKNGKSKLLKNMKNEMYLITAHELRTPITTLKLMTQIYIRRLEKGIAQIKMDELRTMDQQLDRLIGLINDLLDTSTTSKGKVNLKLRQVNISELILEVIDQINVSTNQYSLIFTNNLTDPNKSQKIHTDPNRVTQVLINLIDNARKYSPPNSTIKVEASRLKNKIIISVIDQGEGIPQAEQKKIFDKNYQLERKSKKGVGLGLYISKEIINALKGKIWIKSTETTGSTFSFSLPAN